MCGIVLLKHSKTKGEKDTKSRGRAKLISATGADEGHGALPLMGLADLDPEWWEQ